MSTDTWTPLRGPAHDIALQTLLHGPLSRAELARRLDLSAGSLTRLTRPLLDAGLLVEVADQTPEARPGRPGRPLDVVEDAHHFIGIKLTGDTAYGVLTTLRADVLADLSVPLPDHAPDTVADTVADLVADLSRHAPTAVTGIGIGLGGHVVDAAVAARSRFLEWEDVPLAAMVQERTSVATVLANDVTALTEATHWFGAGRDVGSFALITIGAGIGYGLVVHDRLVEHEDASRGLLGHHPLDSAGPRCHLGHRGCASAMLTIPSIVSQVTVARGRETSYDEVLDLAVAGDAAARRVVDDSARALGRLIACVANVALPERVVVGGEGVRLAVVAQDAVLAGIRDDRVPTAGDPEVRLLSESFAEWARGAAVIAIQTFVLGR